MRIAPVISASIPSSKSILELAIVLLVVVDNRSTAEVFTRLSVNIADVITSGFSHSER
jgi:hypothetical protein